MIVSKHLHSCLLVEEAGKSFLIDPGIYTYEEKALQLNTITKLDYLLITHEHTDHMYLPFVKEIINRFPEVQIKTNKAVVSLLHEEKIAASYESDAFVQVTPLPHEALWDKPIPENVQITIANKLMTPGDSHHFTSAPEILALPIQAPWGSTIDAVNLAVKLKPKVIIPIHDWMWKDSFRKEMYERLTTYFAQHKIIFKPCATGEKIEIV